MHWKQLINDQIMKVLESHIFLEKKRIDRNIKGRKVSGGNKQQSYIPKEDASLTTVSTKAVLLTCIINSEKNRDVAVIDIPNAFIQTRVENKNDKAFIKIWVILVGIFKLIITISFTWLGIKMGWNNFSYDTITHSMLQWLQVYYYVASSPRSWRK